MIDRPSLLALIRQRIELRFLVAMLFVAACGWVFLALAGEVLDGETHAFDRAILLAFRTPGNPADPLGPGWLEEMARDVTALGSMVVLSFVTLAVAGYLLLLGKFRSMLVLLGSVAGAIVVSFVSKAGFDRPRPDIVPRGVEVYTPSFPSAHAMLAAATYLTLAVMLTRIQSSRALRVYVVAVAVLLSVAVGVSRLYLGVHWPTDVLAGWAAGAGWALLCWMLADQLQRRGAIEAERGPED